MAETAYDAVIIGVGQAGGPLAQALAKAGRRVALIERDVVGGTCINRGCTPTKTMIASARVAYLAGRGADFGVQTGPVTVDLAKVRQRKRDIVKDFRGGEEKHLEETDGINLIYGEAKFTGPKTVEIALRGGGTQQVTAEQFFINTGARPTVPKIDGLNLISFLDSTSIMELGAVPEHLIILGGSYIALEFGQMFRRFGSQVTVVERSDRLMEREDGDVSEEITKIVTEDGLTILTEAKATKAAQSEAGVTLTLETKTGEKSVTGSHLLVAVGRTPNTDALDLPAAGIEADDHGFIKVSDILETTVPGVYALGDVKGGPQFTHISYDDFRIIQTNLLEHGSRTTAGRMVPYTMFTDPQLGRVGMTEAEAKKSGKNIQVAKIPMTEVARAIETDETRGFMKAVVDVDTKQILGAAILCVDGGEVMAVLEVAMMGHLPYTSLKDATLAHPTLAESLNNLFMTLE
jgi:pyruvate/2-oxoglutarate dehydrogenase complex dihydrolipoamide dehydrogenase (E3) component